MKWTNLIHVLIDKVEALVQVLSQVFLLLQVLVKLLEQCSIQGLLSFGEGEKLTDPENSRERGYLDEELVTIKVAMGILKVSRWKIYDFVDKEELTKIEKGNGGVRFILKEVEALRYSYSVKKGKV